MEISHQEALILSTIRGHLKGSVHREIDPAESDVIRKVFVKERGARIFRWFPPSSILWDLLKVYHRHLVPKSAGHNCQLWGKRIYLLRKCQPIGSKEDCANCTEKQYFFCDIFLFKRGGSNPWTLYVAKFIFWFLWKRFQNFTGPFRVTSWLHCDKIWSFFRRS